MDPNYYSAEEAAYMAHFKQSKLFFESGLLSVLFLPVALLIPINFFVVRRANRRMSALFSENSLPATTVMPKTKESGFVFASVDQGTKHVKIDLIGNETRVIFNFAIPVPGIKADYTTEDFTKRYSKETLVEYTDKDFPKYLDQLPCCATNKKGTQTGDPLNLVVIGEFEDLITIFGFSSWDETSALTPASGFSMFKAFLTGENDRYSPISPLYYRGHPQDIAFQKTRNSINQRLHFRLWYTPVRYNGKPVWVGAISRDIGVKFTFTTWYLTTHKIDPNLDDSRDYLFAELIDMEKISKYGFVENIALKQPGQKNENLTGDPYFTDNQRIVLKLSIEDTSFAPFSWERPSEDAPSQEK